MIVIAPDKFKGTFTAAEICAVVSDMLRRGGYSGRILECPLSDGGEGIATVLMPGGRRVAPGVYADDSGRFLAVSSEIVGFGAFDGKDIPLMQRSSYALGRAVASVGRGRPVSVAVGGTAVSDGGAGFLHGLGARFFDADGHEITDQITPDRIFNIASADLAPLAGYNLSGIIDVKASLTGPGLSALDFARQKALPGENLELLPQALEHLQGVLGGHSEWDGAGGGLGYAIASVLGAPCRSGAEVALEAVDIPWNEVELIITGEGHVDAQTVHGGKLVDAVWRLAVSRHVPCVVAYGMADSGLPYTRMIQIADNEGWLGLAKKI